MFDHFFCLCNSNPKDFGSKSLGIQAPEKGGLTEEHPPSQLEAMTVDRDSIFANYKSVFSRQFAVSLAVEFIGVMFFQPPGQGEGRFVAAGNEGKTKKKCCCPPSRCLLEMSVQSAFDFNMFDTDWSLQCKNTGKHHETLVFFKQKIPWTWQQSPLRPSIS